MNNHTFLLLFGVLLYAFSGIRRRKAVKGYTNKCPYCGGYLDV